MAELSLSGPSKIIFTSLVTDVIRRKLVLASGSVTQGTAIDINVPGTNWSTSGPSVFFSDAVDFYENFQVYRNGQLLDVGTAANQADIYPLISGAENSQVVCEFPIGTNDQLQFWKYEKT